MTWRSASPRSRLGREVFAWALGAWGLLHLVGGASLMAMEGAEGLDTLGPGATMPAPDPAGDAAAAVVHFHGLNIAAAGLAVLLLAMAWRRTGKTWQALAAAGLAGILDGGLVAFLVAPGLLPVMQGIWGPALLGLGLAGYAVHKYGQRLAPAPSARALS